MCCFFLWVFWLLVSFCLFALVLCSLCVINFCIKPSILCLIGLLKIAAEDSWSPSDQLLPSRPQQKYVPTVVPTKMPNGFFPAWYRLYSPHSFQVSKFWNGISGPLFGHLNVYIKTPGKWMFTVQRNDTIGVDPSHDEIPIFAGWSDTLHHSSPKLEHRHHMPQSKVRRRFNSSCSFSISASSILGILTTNQPTNQPTNQGCHPKWILWVMIRQARTCPEKSHW